MKSSGCCGIKVSFEDEGALLNEIMTMRYLTASVGLELSVKIGGCEAKRDIVDVINVCADYIVAPMVESGFSLNKFVDSLDQYKFSKKSGINIETITSVANIEEMSKHFNKIDFVTFGRVDFIGSIQQSRDIVDSDKVFDVVRSVFKKARETNTACYMGGSISIKSKSFISRLMDENLLDKFETRYVMYDAKNINMDMYDELIRKANAFEIEWINYISSRYADLKNKDARRVNMLVSRMTG
jgi:hypothetical protein